MSSKESEKVVDAYYQGMNDKRLNKPYNNPFNKNSKKSKHKAYMSEMINYWWLNERGEMYQQNISTDDPTYVRHDDKVVVINDFGKCSHYRNFNDEKNRLIQILQERIEKIKTWTEENYNE
jgi:hypothetical protein